VEGVKTLLRFSVKIQRQNTTIFYGRRKVLWIEGEKLSQSDCTDTRFKKGGLTRKSICPSSDDFYREEMNLFDWFIPGKK
jgi:hypothetical protein